MFLPENNQSMSKPVTILCLHVTFIHKSIAPTYLWVILTSTWLSWSSLTRIRVITFLQAINKSVKAQQLILIHVTFCIWMNVTAWLYLRRFRRQCPDRHRSLYRIPTNGGPPMFFANRTVAAFTHRCIAAIATPWIKNLEHTSAVAQAAPAQQHAWPVTPFTCIVRFTIICTISSQRSCNCATPSLCHNNS